MYAKGMTLSDIRMQLQELYHGADISESVISQITDDVIDDVKAWQNRPLESIYPIVDGFLLDTNYVDKWTNLLKERNYNYDQY
ncbi:hypothetical protein SHM_07200 [Spiroplasma ixodetis]|uniref:Mutator family transposase n=1 Tax=Spiroplasma ixodetis TaxID=2141 RepID=A0ABM8BTN6_9MOLU|nr:hypothetical protein SHM_07200 [Spiroplasma ixodetis]